ncbi:MAG TPA: hypothetical protein PK076_07705 [Saprospiraceae bacterium]|nr:hypothetical protein [Saprospiraceae bacterium]
MEDIKSLCKYNDLKNNKHGILILLVIFCVSMVYSCSFKGTFQGLTSYYKKTSELNSDLIQEPSSDTSLEYRSDVVYRITGSYLKQQIINENKVLIYLWSPNCSSSICIPLNVLQKYAIEHKLDLYVVATYYDYEQMNKVYNLVHPIYSIDVEYYKSNLTSRYLKKFLKDLMPERDILPEEHYLIFERGKMVRALKMIV